MPSLVASLEGTVARAGSQIGQWWPNPWWPGGNPNFNDCAAFVSWCLWGLNGDPVKGSPYEYVVSGIIERSGLEFHAGAAGIRRGDIAGFRWTVADNYDHTEIVLGPPNAQGFIQTIGANGGGSDRVAVHTRSTGYVHNYARPAYPATTTAGGAIAQLSNGETDMIPFQPTSGPTADWPFLIGPGIIQNVPTLAFAQHYGQSTGQPVQKWDDAAIWIEMCNHGLAELSPTGQNGVQTFLASLAGAKRATATWLGAGGLVALNLTPVLAAITALDKQADDYEAKVEGILNKGLTISGTAKP